MKNKNAVSYLFLIIIIGSIFLYWINVCVYMDDVFIYFRVARNIVNGTGPVYNLGDSHFPVTSPLWVFLLALFKKVFFFLNWIVLAKALYIVFLALASWLAFLILRKSIGAWAVITPIPIFFNHITLSSAGGEIALVYFFIFATLLVYSPQKWKRPSIKDVNKKESTPKDKISDKFISNYKKYFQNIYQKPIMTGIMIAFAYLSRGELALLAIPIGIHYLYIAIKEKQKLGSIIYTFSKIALGFLIIALIWHTYYAIQFQTLFPNTLNTKIVQGKSGMWNLYYRFGRIHTLSILREQLYLLVFLLFGLFYFRFYSFYLLSFTILHYYIYQYLVIPHYHWYYYDFYLIIPLFILLGGAALFKVLRQRIQGIKWRVIQMAIGFTTVTFLIITSMMATHLDQLYRYRKDERLIRYSRISDWMNKRLNKGDVLLCHEIGIFGYYLEEAIIRDLNGLASPDVTVDNINDLGYFVNQYRPNYILFPAWLPQKKELKYIATSSEEFPTLEKAESKKELFKGTSKDQCLFGGNDSQQKSPTTGHKNRLAVYKMVYAEKKNDQIKETVFYFKKILKPGPYIRLLEELRKNAKYYPNREYEIQKGDSSFILIAPAPFESYVNIPSTVTGVKIPFGFLTGDWIQKTSNDIIFKIYGANEHGQKILYEKHLKPSDLKNLHDTQVANISFKSNEFTKLRFSIKYLNPSEIDYPIKTYWGRLRFFYQSEKNREMK